MTAKLARTFRLDAASIANLAFLKDRYGLNHVDSVQHGIALLLKHKKAEHESTIRNSNTLNSVAVMQKTGGE